MKVALVCPYAFDAHGGVQDQVGRLVSWLRSEGDEAWAVAPGSGGPEGTRHVGRFVSWRANRSRAPIAIDPRVVRRVATAVADADVVHVHEPLMPMVSVGALLAETPPTVGTFHADPGRLGRGIYRGVGPVTRRLIGRLNVVTAVSEVAASALPRGVAATIVPNGIDVDRYAGTGGDRTPGRVVFIGRDDARKGLDVLRAAWPDVIAGHPEASLVVVGAEGPNTARISYLGRTSEEAKIEALLQAEVLVAPNRGGESFGIVVLEGLAAGCAVVASDLPAFRALAGDAARYVRVGDARALAAQVVSLLTDAAAVGSLARSGRERAARFGRDAVLGAYRAAYEAAGAAP